VPVAFVYLAARIVDFGVRWAVAVRVLLSIFMIVPLLICVQRLVAVMRRGSPPV